MMTEQITFLSEETNVDVFDALNKLIHESICIKAAISFWSLNYKRLDNSFLEKIKGDGFLCVDINSPTNIDTVCDIANHGSNVLFHLYKASGKTEIYGTYKMPQHLLHSKIFLFELENNVVKIWLGSHNATNRALMGLNIESSFIVETTKDSTLYNSINNFLCSVKTACSAVNPSYSDYYKWLQSTGGNTKIIEVFDTQDLLSEGSNFALFLTQLADSKGLQSIGSKILISVTSSIGHEEFYWAEIGQSGHLKPYPEIDFSITNFAFRDTSRIPSIEYQPYVPKYIVDKSHYFAVFKLKEKLDPNIRAVESIKTKWIRDRTYVLPESMLDDRVVAERSNKSELVVYRPIPPEKFQPRQRSYLSRSDDHNRSLLTNITLIHNEE